MYIQIWTTTKKERAFYTDFCLDVKYVQCTCRLKTVIIAYIAYIEYSKACDMNE